MTILASRLARTAASLAVLGAMAATPAAAAVRHHHPRYHHVMRHQAIHRVHEAEARPLTVSRPYRPNPFHGPAAIITGPVTLAGMIVSLPFRALGAVFPAAGDPRVNPLVFVGAPIHVAGQIATFPFYAVDSAFGAAPAYN